MTLRKAKRTQLLVILLVLAVAAFFARPQKSERAVELTISGLKPGVSRDAVRKKLNKPPDIVDHYFEEYRLGDYRYVSVSYNDRGIAIEVEGDHLECEGRDVASGQEESWEYFQDLVGEPDTKPAKGEWPLGSSTVYERHKLKVLSGCSGERFILYSSESFQL